MNTSYVEGETLDWASILPQEGWWSAAGHAIRNFFKFLVSLIYRICCCDAIITFCSRTQDVEHAYKAAVEQAERDYDLIDMSNLEGIEEALRDIRTWAFARFETETENAPPVEVGVVREKTRPMV